MPRVTLNVRGDGMTGRAGKTRNIWLVWLVWPFITLGIYHLVWWYKINREARDFDENIKVEPVLSLLALVPGAVIIIPPFVSVYRTGERIGQMQEDAGMERSCNGWIGLVLSFFLSLHALYYQSELNHIWARLGEPEEGSLVALPVTAGGPSTMPNGVAEPQNAEPRTAEPQNGQPQNAEPRTAEPQNGQAQDGQAQDGRTQDGRTQDGQAQNAEPQASQPQAARSGGASGLRSDDGTSARNGPADGDSPGLG
jgi:Domain of unknown function (DUF4234)